jgi:hypothetical protein
MNGLFGSTVGGLYRGRVKKVKRTLLLEQLMVE